jgi:hypothetical protein
MSKRELLKFLNTKRNGSHINPDSILKEYDAFWEMNGIYRSSDIVSFRKKIKGHTELCEDIIKLYNKSKLENEQITLLEDLLAIGYDKDKLVELILNMFYAKNPPTNLWEYADLLYSIKNFRYMSQYLTIIKDESYGEDRQMLILLVGKSKKAYVVPILKELLSDLTVYGHALDALSNFSGDEINHIMHKYIDCNIAWIREIAEKYLSKNNSKSN